MNPIQETYRDKQYCIDEIMRIREVFGNRNTTEEQYDALLKSLGFMMMYCPEEIKTLVYSTLEEATRRMVHFQLHIW